MIANPACAERGCACHDYRDGSGVEMMRREWVGLTDEEIDTWKIVGHESLREFVRAIESKLKEKNT